MQERELKPKIISTPEQEPPQETDGHQSSELSVDAKIDARLRALRAEYADVADSLSSDALWKRIENFADSGGLKQATDLYKRRLAYEEAVKKAIREEIDKHSEDERLKQQESIGKRTGDAEIAPKGLKEQLLRAANSEVRDEALRFYDRVLVLDDLLLKTDMSTGWYGRQRLIFLSQYKRADRYPLFHILIGSTLNDRVWRNASIKSLDYSKGRIAKFVEGCIKKLQSGEWQKDVPESKELVDEFVRKIDILRGLLSTTEKRASFSNMLDFFGQTTAKRHFQFYSDLVAIFTEHRNLDLRVHYYSSPSILDQDGNVMKFLDTYIDRLQRE